MTKSKPGKKTRKVIGAATRAARKATTPPVAVTVTFRHVASSPALRTYAERKFSHLAKLLKRACQTHLILTIDKYRQHGEVTLKSGRTTVTAEHEAKDLYAVIDLLADKVGRQLKSQQGKARSKKLRAPSTGEVLSAVEEETPSSGASRV